MPRPHRVGLLGGSFDPVHIGHVLLARWARRALRLDEVWLVPQSQSADGKRLSPMLARWRAVQRAVKGEVGLRACDVDLRLGGVSRTIETLRQLHFEHGSTVRWTWLLGQDQALRLPQWQEAAALPALANFAYFFRPGCRSIPKSVHTRFRTTAILVPSIDISSSRIRHQSHPVMAMDLAKLL